MNNNLVTLAVSDGFSITICVSLLYFLLQPSVLVILECICSGIVLVNHSSAEKGLNKEMIYVPKHKYNF